MKNKKWLWVMFVLVVIFGFCFSTITRKNTLVSKGDILGGMTVTNVEPFNTGQYSQDPSLIKIGPQNMSVFLSGPITITGIYFHPNELNELLSGYCMKDFDEASLEKLPQLQWIKEPLVFCFRNYHFANEKLGNKTQNVTVIIDNFILNSFPNVSNSAELIDIKY